MPLNFIPLSAGPDLLNPVFDDMERSWQEAGRPGSIRSQLESRKSLIQQATLRGLLALDRGQPCGMAWVDLPHGIYGSVLLHTLRPEHRTPLARAFIQSGFIDGAVVELVQFQPGEEFHQVFRALSMKEHLRQKMALELHRFSRSSPPPDGVRFHPLGMEHADLTGAISVAAHQQSRDLDGYPDFSTPQRRAALERSLFHGLYGPIIQPASRLLHYQNRPVGICLMVGLSGWGYPRVGWVLDMAVEPSFQGRGFGRALLEESLHGAVKAELPVVGLAVTLTNAAAIHLYEKVGFHVVERFHEYIGPRTV
jgi:ribosomal protein S18 acetylase RimI-like enzyme